MDDTGWECLNIIMHGKLLFVQQTTFKQHPLSRTGPLYRALHIIIIIILSFIIIIIILGLFIFYIIIYWISKVPIEGSIRCTCIHV